MIESTENTRQQKIDPYQFVRLRNMRSISIRSHYRNAPKFEIKSSTKEMKMDLKSSIVCNHS